MTRTPASALETESRTYNRREIVGATAAVAGTAVLTTTPAAAQGTPAATPAVPEGAIVSSVDGVPIAYTTFPEPFRTVEGVPGSGSTVRALILS